MPTPQACRSGAREARPGICGYPELTGALLGGVERLQAALSTLSPPPCAGERVGVAEGPNARILAAERRAQVDGECRFVNHEVLAGVAGVKPVQRLALELVDQLADTRMGLCCAWVAKWVRNGSGGTEAS